MATMTNSTTLKLSRLAAGTWKLSEWNWTTAQYQTWIAQCLELGISSFDLADIYGSYTGESLFGQALAAQPSLRARLQLITKCGIKLLSPQRPQHRVKSYDTSMQHIIASAEKSLRNLQTDYLDLLLLHRPDPLMAPDEIAEAFSRLLHSGKVRHFGVSNFTTSQFEMLNAFVPLYTNQVECSLLHLDPLMDGTFDQAIRLQRTPMIWSPVGSGELFRSSNERETRIRQTLAEIGVEQGVSSGVIAIAWLLRHPAKLIPIIGSSKITRYQEAMHALSIELSREQWHRLWVASLGRNTP